MCALVVSENVLLRPLTLKDAAQSIALVEKNREHLGAWLPWVKDTHSVDDEVNYINQSAAAISEGRQWEMGLFVPDDTSVQSGSKKDEGSRPWKMIGMCGLVNIDREDEEPYAALGYWLDKDHAGRGLITKACRKVINQAFTTFKLTKVKIMVHCENASSISVAKRLNFKLSAEKVSNVNEMYHRDQSRTIVYTLHRDDWESPTDGSFTPLENRNFTP